MASTSRCKRPINLTSCLNTRNKRKMLLLLLIQSSSLCILSSWEQCLKQLYLRYYPSCYKHWHDSSTENNKIFLLYIKYIHLNRHYLNECWLRNHFPPLDLDLSGSHTIWEHYKIRKMNLNFKIFALSLFIVSIGKMPKSVFGEANKKMYCTVLSLTELKPIVVLYLVCSLDW